MSLALGSLGGVTELQQGLCGLSQTHQTIVVQLLQSTMRLLECPWLQQQHKGSVEACIRTLAMVGECACARLRASPPLLEPRGCRVPALTLGTSSLCRPVACPRWFSANSCFSPASPMESTLRGDT